MEKDNRFITIMENYVGILERDNDILKADNKRLQDRNGRLVLEQTLLNDKDGLYDEVKELQAENITLMDDLEEEQSKVKELKAEIRQLKADAKHDADVCYDVDDEHIAEIKALKEQVSDLMIDKEELQDGVSRLMNQVSSNNGNSSSTHTHTISGEIAEYMSHNEGCGGARLFLIPRDAFDGEGVCNDKVTSLYWDDGIE